MNNSSPGKVLIIDDDADLRKLVIAWLSKLLEGTELEEYDPVARGIPSEDFDWAAYDVLILDYYLSVVGVTGLDILQANRKNPDFPATVMLTGAGNEEVAVRALKAGVYDYLRKEKMDKQVLQDAILHAYRRHKSEKERLAELTQQRHAFNKAVFYQQLEYKKGDPEYRNRAFYLITLDDSTRIEKQVGIIFRDNIVRHIAKQCYGVYKSAGANPAIIRLGDASVALLADAPESDKVIEENVSGLLATLQERPYTFDDKKFRFTVSIGVVRLPESGESADTIIRYAKSAGSLAAKQRGHSYHLYDWDAAEAGPERKKTEPATASPGPKPPSEPATGSKPKAETRDEKAVPATPPAEATQPASTGGNGEDSEDLKDAFEQKRVIQVFQPIISLLNEEMDAGDELHSVTPQYIDKDGAVRTWEEIKPGIRTPEFQKFVDRWSLQEIIGRLTSNENNRYTFIIRMSDASLADATFFNWLRKLLSGLDSRNPGKSIAMEIAAGDLGRLLKQAGALVNYLRKAHDFKFVLGDVHSADEVTRYANSIIFDYVRCSCDIIRQLQTTGDETDPDTEKSEENGADTPLAMIKSRGTRFIADDIEDATSLTEAIGIGTDYACGHFIGEPVDRLDDMTNIETFEIA